MLHLWYSNSLRSLVDALIRDMETSGNSPQKDLFCTSSIIVPNRNIEAYLKFEIAKRTGIAANLRFYFLEEFLSGLIKRSGIPMRVVDRKVLHSLLVTVFSDGVRKNSPLPKPVEVYLKSGGSTEDEIDLRIFQLSAHLSRSFEEYIHSRREMVTAWEKGTALMTSGPFADTEAWQSEIWRMLFSPGGRLHEVGAKKGLAYLKYGDIFDSIPDEKLVMPAQLHLFGFSYISRLFNQILRKLSLSSELFIYTLNPCMEFWEDLQTFPEEYHRKVRFLAREKKRGGDGAAAESEDPYGLTEGDDTPALRLWGRPGRENIHLLNEFSEFSFDSVFEGPIERGPSLLRYLQHDILLREPERRDHAAGLNFEGDRSIRVLACPGIQREVEIIASEIWALLKDDGKKNADETAADRLRFNDIAVIIADTREFTAYRTHIAAAFSEIYDIPHTITDIAMEGESRVLEALDLLFELPLGNFDREELLRLLIHPSVLCRFPGADPDEWTRWCHELNIVHGVDHNSHKDTYIEKDLYNWDQGVRRLVLGAFMTGRQSGDTRPFIMEGCADRYLPEEFRQGSNGSAAAFGLLVRSLVRDSLFFRDANLSMAEWSDCLMKMVSAYIGASSQEDEHILSRCQSLLFSMREMDLDDAKVSYTIAREFASSLLSGIQGSKGQYLTNGVVVSSFLPMRPIPFRAVFIAGMGEGRFPTQEIRDPLDLRSARRFPGDVSPRERDQYMFLETLVSTRDTLCLSYVSRDSQTGEELKPSSVISELLYLLGRGYMSREQIDRMVIRHPLRRYDRDYFPDLFPDGARALPSFSPAARSEAHVLALREDRKAFYKGKEPTGIPLPPRLNIMLGLCAMPDSRTAEADDVRTVSITQIRKFLNCPMQGWAAFHLGLKQDEEMDLVSCVDEVFSIENLHGTPLLKETFLAGLNSKDRIWDFSTAYEKKISYMELAGTAPTGVFLDVQRKAHADVLTHWKVQYESLSLPLDENYRTFRFGRAEENVAVDELLPPVILELDDKKNGAKKIRVELFGKTEPVSLRLPASLLLNTREAGTKHYLPGFLDYILLTLAGFVFEEDYRVIMLSNGKAEERRLRRLDREEAVNYIKRIISEMLFNTHAYLLPIEALLDYRKKRSKADHTIRDSVDMFRNSDMLSYSSLYGPVPHPESYGPPDEKDARQMLTDRFGFFFDVMGES